MKATLKKTALAWCVIAAFPTLALAQQQPDPAFLQQALAAVQQQRNAALDGQAQTQAVAAVEIAKLKARIEELEKAAPPPAN